MTDAAPTTVREPGFYWVRNGDDWVACQWRDTFEDGTAVWAYPGSEVDWSDADFSEIGPKIDPPAAPRMAELKDTLVGPPT